jgi:DNA-binding CsgD family transcriptional regulator
VGHESQSSRRSLDAHRNQSCTRECAGPLVEHAKSTAIRIERLPAVATLDWCDQAAQALALEFCRAIAIVIVGTINASGEITNIEAGGVGACGDCGTNHADAIAGVRSEIEAIGMLPVATTPSVAVSLRELSGDAWSASRVGRVFRPLPLTDAFVTIQPIAGSDSGRSVISIVGVTAESVPVSKSAPADVQALLWSSTVHIAERAAIAIGGQRSTRGRWISEREREVLDLLVLGLSVRQIAEELGRSTHTVHDHVKSLHKKLNANSRGELVARALGHLGAGRVPVKTTLNAMPGSAIEPSKSMIDLTNDIGGEIEQKQEAGHPGRAKRLPLD